MNPAVLNNLVVVLDHPQNLVNIAGAVRAMKNMGIYRLRLVNPAEYDSWRIGGIAHRSADVAEGAEIFESLQEALSDAIYVVGTTARARTAQRNYVRPRDVAPTVIERAQEGVVALLFGREDRGLENEGLDLCHSVAIIPTNPDYSSLNMAQATLLLTYEVFLAAGGDGGPLPKGRRNKRPATVEELESTYAALEQGLDRIDFFKARAPEAILRTLRTVLGRAQPDLQEAGILRAIGFEIGAYMDRTRNRSSVSGSPSPEEEESEPER